MADQTTPPESSEPLLRTEGLTKVFEHGGRRLEVLSGIDLVLQRGEMLSVVGMSGAGKSTLLHILGTIDRPSAGKIYFEGARLDLLSAHQLAQFRNRAIGFVFQFHHLLPEFTALENVMMPLLIGRQAPAEARRGASAVLESVGLHERMSHRPGELSGGEQQRVALARALAPNPQLLLADEPTGNLDARTGGEIHELFFRLNARYGTTMLVVTHNPQLAGRMQRTLYMADGRLHEESLYRGDEAGVAGAGKAL